MMRDQVPGWRPVERIAAGLRCGWAPATVRTSRWLSPTGVEATIVTFASVGSTWKGVPAVASSPALARDSGLVVGGYVLDPQLCWHDIDGHHLLVSPVIGLRVSVRVPGAKRGVTIGGARRNPCRVAIEILPTVPRAVDAAGPVDPATLTGSHPGVLTRWPVAATTMPEATVSPASRARAARLVTGPAAFLREDHEEPASVG